MGKGKRKYKSRSPVYDDGVRGRLVAVATGFLLAAATAVRKKKRDTINIYFILKENETRRHRNVVQGVYKRDPLFFFSAPSEWLSPLDECHRSS